MTDRYGNDVLSTDWRAPKRGRSKDLPAERDLVVEDAQSGYVGAVVRVEKAGGMHVVHLEDRHGRTKAFPLGPGFLIDGAPVNLTPPRPADAEKLAAARKAATRTASGSVAVHDAKAREARGSRIFVEGRHDAELVEKVWGHDLRVEGVVVEYLEGLDNLEARLAEFGPGPGRRVGVLADHLVTGSKESRLTESVGEHVLVTGHPFIDIWAAVKPERLRLTAWPDVPYGEDWKTGVCRRVGWSDPQEGWRRVSSAVTSFRDLDSTLIGAVERLVDFVTTPELSKSDLM